jgi:transcriptional regulator with XRE-family HTH domain
MPSKTPAEIGEAVRDAIASKRITQIKLAGHLGVSRAAVVRRLSGEVEFSATEIATVATLTDTSLDRLLVAA